MLLPCIGSRVVQRNEQASLGVNRRTIGSLVQVASNAGQAQVGRIIGPPVLSPDDVVDLMG